jgi:hypothetical protein
MPIDEKTLRTALEAMVETDQLPPPIVDDLVAALRESCTSRIGQGHGEAEALAQALHDLRSIIDSAPQTYHARPLRRHRPIGAFIFALVCWIAFYWIASLMSNFEDMYRQMGMERLPIFTEISLGVGLLANRAWPVLLLPIPILLFLIFRQKTARWPFPAAWQIVLLIGGITLLAATLLMISSVFLPMIELQKKLGGG